MHEPTQPLLALPSTRVRFSCFSLLPSFSSFPITLPPLLLLLPCTLLLTIRYTFYVTSLLFSLPLLLSSFFPSLFFPFTAPSYRGPPANFSSSQPHWPTGSMVTDSSEQPSLFNDKYFSFLKKPQQQTHKEQAHSTYITRSHILFLSDLNRNSSYCSSYLFNKSFLSRRGTRDLTTNGSEVTRAAQRHVHLWCIIIIPPKAPS